jgi:hypothetical protein
MTFVNVAYVSRPGYDEGTPFGPCFPSEEKAWDWFNSFELKPVPVDGYSYVVQEPVGF